VPTTETVTLFEWFRAGGVLMWPILATSIFALAIALERFFVLRRATIDTRELMDTVRTILRQGKPQEAVQICDEADVPVARILKAGLLKHDRPKIDIREALENAGSLEVPRLERYLSALATCANIAPLLGLLGTVQGMLIAFEQIKNKQGLVNPSDLAEGIGNALITTFAGLAVAIPVLVVHNYYISRVDNMVLEMESSASELTDLLTKDRARETH